MHDDDGGAGAVKRRAIELIQRGEYAAAVALLESRSCGDDHDAEACYWLGVAYGHQERFKEAGAAFRRALAVDPQHDGARVKLGKVLTLEGRHDEALAQFQAALRVNPRHGEACFELGYLYYLVGDHDRAAACLEDAIRLDFRKADAYYNLGNLRAAKADYAAAADCYRQSIAIDPGNAVRHGNLGNVLYKQGRLQEAMESQQRAIAIDPTYAEAYNNCGIILSDLGMWEQAAQLLDHALRLAPKLVQAYGSLGKIYSRWGDAQSLTTAYRKALEVDPLGAGVHSSLLMEMNYVVGVSPDDLASATRDWGRLHGRGEPGAAGFLNSPDPGRPLRIGYVSGDLHGHPVGLFLEPVLAARDRSAQQVYCYYNNAVPDQQTERLRALADHWRAIVGVPDPEVIEQIRNDGIDILVDLSGHTAANRLPLFAHRPAPVQAAWLGYLNTTGLDTMDYLIADEIAVPPEDDRHYTETVLRLPHCFLCFSPPDSVPEVNDPPCLTGGAITFGSYNNTAKLSREVIGLWAEIMRRVPGSRIHLKCRVDTRGESEYYGGLFEECGIDRDRVCFSTYLARDHYYDELGGLDIALDPFPYNGGTTTIDTLWMGVPVISLRGNRYLSRMGASILTTIGMEELVADSEDDYIAKAVALASDRQRLRALRHSLRHTVAASPLCDQAGFATALERLYRGVWNAWCQSVEPRDGRH